MNKIFQTLEKNCLSAKLFICLPLFMFASITIIGISCDEPPRALMSTRQMNSDLREIYDTVNKEVGGYQVEAAALIMISRSIDRLTDAVKEHECLSK